MNPQQVNPKLRFGGHTKDWKRSSLGELCKVNQGLQIPISERFLEPGEQRHFYITNEFLKKGSTRSYYIMSPNKSVLCDEDDVLMTRTGNTGIVVTGVRGAFHNNFFKIKFNRELLDKDYLVLFLRSPRTKHKILTYAGQSTIPDLNHKDFYSLEIQYPTLEEQKKISSFFLLLNQKVEKQEEKVEQLELFKKGMMQKIFSQEIRFKDENGKEFPKWINTTVEKIARLEKGFTPRTNDSSLWDGDIPWLSIAGLNQGKYIDTASKWITKKAINDKNPVPKGTLIMSFKLTLGRLGIIKEEMYTNEAICHFYWKNNNIDTEYVYYYLSSIDIQSFGSRAAKGITLNNESLNSIVIKLPDYREQQKIASFFSKVDLKIEKEKDKLEHLKKVQKGFFQQMFI
ncbi:restriction endonuclease subunit S [Salirhabdus salicampi]|uniref:restriction endonuclease subunit S n=1 Tax=Salirhabdus salicampi TaxID=476102 RepID=UPI0020C21736|nr:restriction endonuclease subunit S [Salirhabdus salicampi]MCP8615232.1 restriction endonuclease subunit S [Salirhabdus salicampi]